MKAINKILKILTATAIIATTATAQTWEIGHPNPADVIAVLDENGTLTISGTGDMRDWSSGWHWGTVIESITNAIIEDGVANIGSSAFFNCLNLTSVIIPNSVTTIRNSAFVNTALTSITIPNSVTTIGNWAFAYTALTSVTIPNSVTTVGGQTFANCRSLTSVTIGSSVRNIGDLVFTGSKNLTEIISLANVPPITNNAFSDVNRDIPVYVPADYAMFYRIALEWRDFNNIIGVEETSISNAKKSNNRHGVKFAVNPVSEKAEISVILPNNERAIETNVVIYDMTGNVVHSGATTASATGGAIVWDLRNSAGRFVANGTYLVIAEVKTVNGKVYQYSSRLGVNR